MSSVVVVDQQQIKSPKLADSDSMGFVPLPHPSPSILFEQPSLLSSVIFLGGLDS